MHYKSKQGQDRWVIETLGSLNSGYFVDIGAHDGISNSNSYVFEHLFGWSGICIEPNPNMRSFQRLVNNRKCVCENIAVWDFNGEIDFVARGRHCETSGVPDKDVSEYILEDLVKQKKHGIIKVPCMTLQSILDKHSAPKVIDYLSIDTEGSEYNILKDFDFSKYIFKTVTIETKSWQPYTELKFHKNRDKIMDLFVSNGYEFIKHYVVDDYFVHKSLI